MPQRRRDIKRLILCFALASAMGLTACSSTTTGDTGLVQLSNPPTPESTLDNALNGRGGLTGESDPAGADATRGSGEFIGLDAEAPTPDADGLDEGVGPGDAGEGGDTGPSLSDSESTPADALSDAAGDASGGNTEPDSTEPDSTEPDSTEPDSATEEDSVTPPICEPGTTSCQGQSVAVCLPSGEAWTVIATCPDDQPCVDGTCCAPNCEGKGCGDDGCGGLCGQCGPGQFCEADGSCVAAPACEEGASCEDGDPCTNDSCGASGCVNAPLNCEDGDPCTNDSCGAQGCVNAPLNCEDGDPCTEDLCGASGCVNAPKACDDSDPCTEDSCDASGCVNAPKACDDGKACTLDACAAGECLHTVQEDACLIAGACVGAGTTSDESPCMACVPAESQSAYSPTAGADCNDGDPCTKEDICVLQPSGKAACEGTPVIPVSDNPCIKTTCSAGAIGTEALSGVACEPEDPCASEGSCLDGICIPSDPCECYEDSECALNEVCEGFSCTTTFCGNGICDPEDEIACPEDCVDCASAAWCGDFCNDPITANPTCPQECCGDGFCALQESATCCPEDCDVALACGDAPLVDQVPALVQGNTNGSNAVLSADPSTCGDGVPGVGFGYGEGREEVVRFVAPYTGTFRFELQADWNSQIWFFEACQAPSETCITTGPNITGAGSVTELSLEAGASIFVVIDSLSIYFGSGPFALSIDGICSPDCQGKSCGPDGCGGICGTCTGDKVCTDQGTCLNASEVCDFHIDCAGNEICGYWPTDGLNRCSALCKGPKNCFGGQICDRTPGSAHVGHCRAKTDKLDVGEPCTDHGSCDSGLCVKGACREACVTQKGCNTGDVCRRVSLGSSVSSACVPPDGDETGDECGQCSSEHCDLLDDDEPTCADLCVTPSDCEGDQTCYFVDRSEGVNLNTVPYSSFYPNALNDALMGCYTVPGGLGEAPDGTPCGDNSECASGRCLPIGAQGQYFCSRPCYKTADCSGGMTCYLTGSNLVSEYMVETGNNNADAFTLLRICVF